MSQMNRGIFEFTMLHEEWEILRDRFPLNGEHIPWDIGGFKGMVMVQGWKTEPHGDFAMVTLQFQTVGRWSIA